MQQRCVFITEMTFTGRPASTDRAERADLIKNVVPADELEAFTCDRAGAIAENAPLAIAVMKEQLRILAGAHPMSPQGFERIQGLRRLVYDSNDYNEGVRAFKEKRKAVFRGTKCVTVQEGCIPTKITASFNDNR